MGAALGFDRGDDGPRSAIEDVPDVLLERRHVQDAAVGNDRHAIAALRERLFPQGFVGHKVKACEARRGGEIEFARGGAGADALDVLRFFAAAGGSSNAA